MKIKAPVIIQDQMVALGKELPELTETIRIEEAFFLDGPISERVAVVDFDDQGALRSGARFEPPDSAAGAGSFAGTEKPIDIFSDPFIQVSVFATVHQTIAMFEEPDTLGRRLTWGFDAPQLLIVPRAGRWDNAYYERESHSLQFFHFESARFPGREVFTCLSHDIVAHETGHAIIDGIAPDLYNAISPQSLALHEAVADLTAVLIAFRSRALTKAVLDQTGGSIRESTAFSAIAEEFGAQRKASGQLRPLRSLLNAEHMPSSGGARTAPHELSEVLSGALYTVMVRMHEDRMRENPDWSSGKALFVAAGQFKRMILRALDYLPPGEISFADYGRAITAADQAFFPTLGDERRWIAEEFARRGIVSKAEELDVHIEPDREAALNEVLATLDPKTLVESDWAAYAFANEQCELLDIPPDTPLRVRPRLDATKRFWLGPGRTEDVRECIFKVSWDTEEQNPAGRGLPNRRQITVGTTLAIDWNERRVRTLLTSDSAARTGSEDRDALLIRLRAEDRLRLGDDALGPDGQPLRSVALGEVSGDMLRVRKSGRMLHMGGLR
jgi:hypothetical protein